MNGWAEIWAALGIEATADRAAIRRAYARRLKTIDQARQPEVFAALRSAYEAAMAAAQGGGESRPAPQTTAEARTPAAPPPERPAAPAPPPEIAAIVQAIAARDAVAAARLLREARLGCKLALADDMALANRLLHALAYDLELEGAAVEEAALILDWYGGNETYRRSPEMDRLTRRLDAEHWYRGLRAAAESWRIRFTRRGGAARLMLGRGRIALPWRVVPGAALMQAFASYGVYGLWMRGRFDADRLPHLEQILKSRRALAYRRAAPRIRLFVLRFWRAAVIGVLVLSWLWQNFGH